MAATVAVSVNALSVSAEARWRSWRRVCGKYALAGHAAVITPGWVWFLLEEQRLDRGQDRPPQGMQNFAGGVLVLFGAILVAAGFRKLGPGALVNADVFGDSAGEWHTGGFYAHVPDPIYIGYGLGVAGRAVRQNSPGMLLVAAWLSALLLAIEAPVERWAHKRRGRPGRNDRVIAITAAGEQRWDARGRLPFGKPTDEQEPG
ncbi:MAG: methyltransferase [Candidatus Dormibacteria bacterium]